MKHNSVLEKQDVEELHPDPERKRINCKDNDYTETFAKTEYERMMLKLAKREQEKRLRLKPRVNRLGVECTRQEQW